MQTSRWKNLWPVFAAFAAVILIFLLLPPFYGLMDDSGFVFQSPDYLKPGGLERLLYFFRTDLEVNGRFRPFLPVLMVGLYGFTQGHPLALHLLNGCLVMGVLAFLALSFQRLWLRLYPQGAWSNESFIPVFFSLLLLYPWTHIGIVLPSMQEKTVFFFGALAVWLFTSDRLEERSLLTRLAKRFLILAVGAFTREQFIFFFPLLLAASFVAERRSKIPWETLAYLAFMVGLVLLVWLLGRHSNYKARYGFDNALVTISRSRSMWLFLGLAAASFLKAFSGSSPWRMKLSRTCFGLALVGFVLMMIPWGMGGYLNTIAAPFTAACVLMFFPFQPSAGLRLRTLQLLPVFALLAMSIEVGTDSLVKSDLGNMLRSEELKAAGRTNLLFAPCLEGMDSMNTYTEKFFGYHLGAQLPPAGQLPPGTSYWVVSRHLGCWPDAFDPDQLLQSGKAQVVWKGHANWSWRILEVKN